ncbi:apolipoprotein M [Gambusia affinis]|uniref:apolipoprotein M n=1 Tax=Gambusia affinis TaxID=33528 RepID=UPI001CDD8D24|nr:apolipoprotein M [Gambusia affinis]
MFSEVWLYLLYFHAFVQQIFAPCKYREQLAVNSLDLHQFAGKWFFKAAVSLRDSDINKFRMFDNIVFTIQDTSNSTLVLTGSMRMGDACIKKNWTYHVQPGRDDLLLEGRPQRRNLLWSGMWANCSDCIVFQELEPPLNETDSEDSLNRFLLYSRQKDVDSEMLTTFLRNSACNGLTASVTLPHEKEFCI